MSLNNRVPAVVKVTEVRPLPLQDVVGDAVVVLVVVVAEGKSNSMTEMMMMMYTVNPGDTHTVN